MLFVVVVVVRIEVRPRSDNIYACVTNIQRVLCENTYRGICKVIIIIRDEDIF